MECLGKGTRKNDGKSEVIGSPKNTSAYGGLELGSL